MHLILLVYSCFKKLLTAVEALRLLDKSNYQLHVELGATMEKKSALFYPHNVFSFCIALRFWKFLIVGNWLSVARSLMFKSNKNCYILSHSARVAVFHFYPFSIIQSSDVGQSDNVG